MKLTIVLLTAAFLNVSARGLTQKVSFSGQNVSLEKVFSEIEKQTGYTVTYTSDILKIAKPVTINIENSPLSEFLEKVLAGQPIKYTLGNKTILLARKTNTASTVDLNSMEASLVPPGSVRGRVVNENGEPLAGANVKMNTTDFLVSTDDQGYYKIENVPQGDYTVIVTYIGYATKMATLKVTGSGVINLDFKLVTSLVNLDQLTVTSTLSARKIRAYPATIAVINQEDLKNRNLNNLANVLEAVPGIIITPGSEFDNSGNYRQPQGLLIRGTSAGAPIKYLIDGVEIISESSGISVLQTLDPNDIEKVEILKGPMASTLYGNGASGGVISITTKKGKVGKTKINFKTLFTQYANDYANYKGYNQNYSMNVSSGSEQFNYLLGVGYNLYPTTKLTDINNGIDDKTWSYTVKIRGKLSKLSADLSLQYGDEKYGSGSTAISTNKYWESLGLPIVPIQPFQDIKRAQKIFLTSLHLTHTIANNLYHDLTIGYNISSFGYSNSTIDTYLGTYANSASIYSKINARYFMFYEHPWSAALKTSITAGFEYVGYESRSMTINSTAPLTDFFTIYTPATENSASFYKSPYSSTGYFAEAVTGFKNNLFLTTGIRYDLNPAYGDNIGAYAQPRVGLSYVITPGDFKIKPRIVWGVSSLAPEPTYKITTITSSAFFDFVNNGNPDIKPQRSQGYEFGADIFYNNNYSLSITYYDQKIKDMITGSTTLDFTTNPWRIITYHYNVAEATNKGLEVSAKAIFEPFTMDVSYTQTTSKWGGVTGQSPSNTIYPHAPNLGIPQRSIFTRLNYKIPSFLSWSKKGGSISLDWRYNGSSYNYDDIHYNLDYNAWLNLPTPKPAAPNQDNYLLWQKGYSNFNLRADYSLANYAALYIDIQNLLDKQGSINGQSFSRFPGRRINFGFNINF